MKRVIKTFILITFIVVILVMGNKVGVVFNKIQAGSENQIESNCKSVNLNGLEKIQGNKKKLCIMKKEENEYIEYEVYEDINESIITMEFPEGSCRVIYTVDDEIVTYKDIKDGEEEQSISFDVTSITNNIIECNDVIELEYGLGRVYEVNCPENNVSIHEIIVNVDDVVKLYQKSEQSFYIVTNTISLTSINVYYTENGLEKEICRSISVVKGENPADIVKDQAIYEISREMPAFVCELKNQPNKDFLSAEKETCTLEIDSIINSNERITKSLLSKENKTLKPNVEKMMRYIEDSEEIIVKGKIRETEHYKEKAIIIHLIYEWGQPEERNYEIESNCYNEKDGTYGGNVHITSEDGIYKWSNYKWMAQQEIVLNETGSHQLTFRAGENVFRNVVINIDKDSPEVEINWDDAAYKVEGNEKKIYYLKNNYRIPLHIKKLKEDIDKISLVYKGEKEETYNIKFSKQEGGFYLIEPLDGICATEKGELHIQDKLNNETVLKIPCIVADSTKPGIITTHLYTDEDEKEIYMNGTWTREDVMIELNDPINQVPAGIEQFQFTTSDPEAKDANWESVKSYTYAVDQNKFHITDTMSQSFYFRAVSNTGVIGETSGPITVKVQKEPLTNATVQISPSVSSGINNWYITEPIITIKHPDSAAYPKKGAEISTHYEICQYNDNKDIIEEGHFPRKFKEGTNEVIDNIMSPRIKNDGEYQLSVWTSNEFETTEPINYNISIDQHRPSNPIMTYSTAKENNFIKKQMIHGKQYLFYSDQTKIALKGYDQGSGVAFYEYLVVPISKQLEEENWTYTMDKKVTLKENFYGTVFVKSVDYAGNKSDIISTFGEKNKEECVFVIDKNKPEKPVIEAQVEGEEYKDGTWVNSSVAIKVSSKPSLSGIERYQYTTEENPSEEDWKELTECEKGTPCFEPSLGWINDKICITSNTNKTYYFRAISNTGMISDINQMTVRVQTTKPQKPSVSITPEQPDGENDWYCSTPEIKIEHPQRINTNEQEAPFKTYYQFYNVEEENLEESKTEMVFEESEEIDGPTILEDGTYILKVWTEDITGNRCETTNDNGYEQYEIRVDHLQPEVKIMLNEQEINSLDETNSYKLFLKEDITIKINSFDAISGIEKVEYQKVSPGNIFEESKNWITSNEFTTYGNEAFIIYARVTDQAGNQIIVNSNGIIIDKEKPKGENQDDITLIPYNLNESGISNKNVPIDLIIKDPKYNGFEIGENGTCSGLKKVSYTISKDGTILKQETLFENQMESISYEDLVKEFRHTLTVSVAEFEMNDLLVTVNAEDNTGNIASNQCKFSIDATKPVITLTYNNTSVKNEKYYNKERIASLTIREENFNSEKLQINVKRNNVPVDMKGVNVHREGKDYKALIMFKEDGDYEVSLHYEDEAGNEAIYNQVDKFIIDTKKPEIKVNYLNSGEKTGNYYRAARRANIEVYEQNYGNDTQVFIYAMRNGQMIQAPKLEEWNRIGDTYKTSVLYQKDGEYKCSIMVTDLAGNSAIYKEDTPFFVDCNAPEVTISGVKDCSANRGDLIPVIKIKDTYIKGDNIQVSLTGTKKGNIAKNIKPVIQGGEYKFTFDIFKKSKEMDDIYTLAVTSSDLAGNKTTEELKFSVNRFGSTYITDEESAKVMNQYVQEEPELVIIETNPDFLKQYFVKCSRNGTVYDLTENEDYHVIKRGTAETWKQYHFIINKENFAEEGFYNISLYSIDSANNRSDNQSKKQEFKFVVDKTSPTCIITGVKNKESYKDEKQMAYFKLEDNSFIDTVSLELNNVVVREFEKEEIEKGKGEFQYEILSKESLQDMKLYCVDAAGNKSVATVEQFLITTNPWVQFYNDKTKFYSVISGSCGVTVLLIISLFIMRRRKKVTVE